MIFKIKQNVYCMVTLHLYSSVCINSFIVLGRIFTPSALNADISNRNTSLEVLAFGLLTANNFMRRTIDKPDADMSNSCRLPVIILFLQ